MSLRAPSIPDNSRCVDPAPSEEAFLASSSGVPRDDSSATRNTSESLTLTLTDAENNQGVSQRRKRIEDRSRPGWSNALVPRTTDVTDETRGKIIYKVKCRDPAGKDKEISRYSRTPFEGLEHDPIGRQESAPIDVLNVIRGKALKTRSSQERATFETPKDKDPGKFTFGVDWKADMVMSTSVRILSHRLIDVFRILASYYPGQKLQAGEVKFEHPYTIVYHYWDELQRVLKACDAREESISLRDADTNLKVDIPCDADTGDDLRVLLNAPPIKTLYSVAIQPELDRQAQKHANFDYLSLLFRPGTIVLVRDDLDEGDHFSGYVVERMSFLSGANSQSHSNKAPSLDGSRAKSSDVWEWVLWKLGYEDSKLIRQSYSFKLKRYVGEKAISELPVVPIRFVDDHDTVRKSLISRGRRYYTMMCEARSYWGYKGRVTSKVSFHYEGGIIVDHEQYLKSTKADLLKSLKLSGIEPNDTRGGPLFSKFNDMRCISSNLLDDIQYFLLPSRVLGFALGSKKQWGVFDMTCVATAPGDSESMNELIIKEDYKKLLLAAAGQALQGPMVQPWIAGWNVDFVEGKGRGRVVLLHGAPGTGKTFTAECVAKRCNRPLLSITTAELGTEETKIQERIAYYLDLASMWGAIVLLDEAEVYLEQRKAGTLVQNALVSAFLSTMEYFPGLLFLTTNGIGMFDEAVISRIHLTIPYPRATLQTRRDIWKALFKKLEADPLSQASKATQPRITVEDETRLRFSTEIKGSGDEDDNLRLNGREIRNTLLTAISIATEEATTNGKVAAEIKLTTKHIQQVLDNRKQLREDFKAATGMYPEALVRERDARGNET